MTCDANPPPRARWRASLGHALLMAALLLLAGAAVLKAGPSFGNIAPQGKASMSSNCGLEPSGQPGPVRPELLIDGRRGRAYDACTKTQKGAWARLDFATPRRIGAIKVYGRADCCWELMGYPLVAELSVDGKTFTAVAHRAIPFTQSEPWELQLAPTFAQAVRIRAESERASLVLSEIEIIEARK